MVTDFEGKDCACAAHAPNRYPNKIGNAARFILAPLRRDPGSPGKARRMRRFQSRGQAEDGCGVMARRSAPPAAPNR
jgi:hypothetical protein